MPNRFSVVCPSGNAEYAQDLVRNLRDKGETCRIVIIADGWLDAVDRSHVSEMGDVVLLTGQHPFNFASNINTGLAFTGSDDVILMEDDARLVTACGLTRLHDHLLWTDYGMLSAAINGVVGNELQKPRSFGEHESCIRPGGHMLAVMCVAIRRRLLNAIGHWDERFTGYGYDDDDFCRRALNAGWKLGVDDSVIVDHNLPSVWRSQADHAETMRANKLLFEQKWGGR